MKNDYFELIHQSTNIVECKGQPLGVILWQGDQWAVTDYGLERRNGKYSIHCKDFCRGLKTKQDVFVFWFKHLSSKSWCNEDDVDAALQAMMVLFDLNGNRTNVNAPSFIGESEIEEYASKCANEEYEFARIRAIQGMVNHAA